MNPLMQMQMPPRPGATGMPGLPMAQGPGDDQDSLLAALLGGAPGNTGGPPQPGGMPPGVVPPGMAPPPGMDPGMFGMIGMQPLDTTGGQGQPGGDLIAQMLMAAGQQQGPQQGGPPVYQ